MPWTAWGFGQHFADEGFATAQIPAAWIVLIDDPNVQTVSYSFGLPLDLVSDLGQTVGINFESLSGEYVCDIGGTLQAFRFDPGAGTEACRPPDDGVTHAVTLGKDAGGEADLVVVDIAGAAPGLSQGTVVLTVVPAA